MVVFNGKTDRTSATFYLRDVAKMCLLYSRVIIFSALISASVQHELLTVDQFTTAILTDLNDSPQEIRLDWLENAKIEHDIYLRNAWITSDSYMAYNLRIVKDDHGDFSVYCNIRMIGSFFGSFVNRLANEDDFIFAEKGETDFSIRLWRTTSGKVKCQIIASTVHGLRNVSLPDDSSPPSLKMKLLLQEVPKQINTSLVKYLPGAIGEFLNKKPWFALLHLLDV